MAKIRINDRTFQTAQFRRMSDEQCQRIHWASLEVMERTGVRLYEQEAIDLVRKAGAHVSDGNLVRLPSGLVEKAFTTVPRRVVLCDRHGNRVMPIESAEGRDRPKFFRAGLRLPEHHRPPNRRAAQAGAPGHCRRHNPGRRPT